MFGGKVDMVLQQFYEAFAKHHIERIFPRGEPFDPNRHEAVSVIETDAVEPDHIAAVFQAGYILHDRVIRPAMVQVAKKQ
jgi:molecular chaperone GrpE